MMRHEERIPRHGGKLKREEWKAMMMMMMMMMMMITGVKCVPFSDSRPGLADRRPQFEAQMSFRPWTPSLLDYFD